MYTRAKNPQLKHLNRRIANHKKARMKWESRSLENPNDERVEASIEHHSEAISRWKKEREKIPEHWSHAGGQK